MKSALVLVLALCALAQAYPKPADKENESREDDSSDTELYIVPLEKDSRRHNFGFLSEDLVPPPFEQHPFFRSNPWGDVAADPQVDSFMMQMQAMLREMREQLTKMLQEHHAHHPDLPDSSVGTRIGDGDDSLPQNKSTSTTKVIDGHVVTVNETTFSSGDDNIGAVFRIKVVEVKPSDESEVEINPEEKPEDVDKIESPEQGREPTTSKSELDEDKHEETNEIPNPNQKVRYQWSPELDPSINEISEPEDFSVEEFEPVKKENYYDLSSDTKVNDYLSDQANHQQLVMIDPDAELIETDANSYQYYPQNFPQRLQRPVYL